MTRRKFIKLNGALVVGATGASVGFAQPTNNTARGMSLNPESVDLLERIRLGQNALLGGLNPRLNYLPYWSCGFAKGDLTGFRNSQYQGEGVWDRMHNVGRALHGLSMAERVTGVRTPQQVIDGLSSYLTDLFQAGDGLPGDIEAATGKRIVNLHNIRESLHGLTALLHRSHPEAAQIARKLVRTIRRSLDSHGRIHLDRLPSYVVGYNHQPSMEGRAVDALVRYYRVSRDDVALETAALMTHFALEHCFSEAGALTDDAGTHGHSINALVAGMIDFAIATNDAPVLERVRRVYDVGLPRFNSSFGWSMESLHKFTVRGESNNTADLLRASLLLGKAGFPNYFGRAEKILRSHLLPSQAVNVTGYSDDREAAEDRLRSLASRIRGGFSFPTPNDLQFKPDAGIYTFDIVSGAVDALCETFGSIVQVRSREVGVNLLLGTKTNDVEIESELPSEGSVRINKLSECTLSVRIPEWAKASEVTVHVAGEALKPRFVGAYLLLGGDSDARQFTVKFPIRKERTIESMAYQPFMIDWQGDQIVAMSAIKVSNPNQPLPPSCMPMFPPCR